MYIFICLSHSHSIRSSCNKVLELGRKDELNLVLSVRSSNRERKAQVRTSKKRLREEIRPDWRGAKGNWVLCILAVLNNEKNRGRR